MFQYKDSHRWKKTNLWVFLFFYHGVGSKQQLGGDTQDIEIFQIVQIFNTCSQVLHTTLKKSTLWLFVLELGTLGEPHLSSCRWAGLTPTKKRKGCTCRPWFLSVGTVMFLSFRRCKYVNVSASVFLNMVNVWQCCCQCLNAIIKLCILKFQDVSPPYFQGSTDAQESFYFSYDKGITFDTSDRIQNMISNDRKCIKTNV